MRDGMEVSTPNYMCYAHFVGCNIIYMRPAVHVKLISVTIHPFIFSESERNARQEL